MPRHSWSAIGQNLGVLPEFSMPERSHNRPPISYRDSGVDIDAGNALVEAIKPLAKATRRPGADADLGGFGALFDLKRAGFKDPILVAANDGVGTKLKIAIETGQHDTIGIDLVAMCVNDLLAQGAEPLFFLDYFACGQARRGDGALGDRRHRRRLPAGRLRADRRRDRRDARHVRRRRTTISPALPSAPWSAARILPRADVAAGDVLIGLPSSGVHSNGYSLVRRLVAEEKLDWDAPAPFDAAALAGRGAAGADAHLRQAGARGRARDRRHQGAGAHHRRRPVGEPAARAAGRHRGACRSRQPGQRRPCSAGCSAPATSTTRRCCAPSTAASA